MREEVAEIDKELLKQINPVYLTARNTIRSQASLGDENAKIIAEYLDKNKNKDVFITSDYDNPITRGFMSVAEYRYKVMNAILETIDADCVLDIPCGYTSRGVCFGKNHKKYIGADLPAVIMDMQDATEAVLNDEEKSYVSYKKVDATNQQSIEAALKDCKGKVCITTEGLLSYFTDSELEAMFLAIHNVLSIHGGYWITPDRENMMYMEKVFQVITKDNPELEKQILERYKVIDKKSDSNAHSNVFFQSDINDAIKWAEDRNFKVERISASEFMPDLVSLMSIRDGIMEEIREACKDINVWKLTAVGKTSSISTKDFSVGITVENNVANMILTGRIDTLAAPEVVTCFEKYASLAGKIVIDFTDVPYISSAGLRALLIIFKKIGTKDNFEIKGCQQSVLEIFEMTGFADMML